MRKRWVVAFDAQHILIMANAVFSFHFVFPITLPFLWFPGTMARIEPNRKWFGNTRLIGQDELDKFRTAVSTAKKDPHQVGPIATEG